MRFVLAYDVSDPRRLRRLARFLEKRALRCQYSVFLFQGDRAAVVRLLDEVRPLLDEDQDVIQAWPVAAASDPELVRGSPRPLFPAGVVLAGRQALFVLPAAPAPDGRGQHTRDSNPRIVP
jgi:CRISPR-associated protein Cas2